MADQATEATPAPEQDQSQSIQAPSQETSATQTTEAPDYFGDNFDPSTLDEALQPAYKQMQGAWTRKTQELAEQRKQAESVTALINDLQSEDPQVKQNAVNWLHQNGLLTEDAIAQAFGYEFEDDSNEEPLDPAEQVRTEWEQFKAQQAQQAAQQQQEQYVTAVDTHLGTEVDRINAQLKEQGRPELTDRQAKLIVKNALVDTQPGQMPDVQSAFEEFAGVLDEGVVSWAATKTGGATTGGGSAATQVPDLDNMSRAERDALMTRMWREADEQGGP
jgi:hypothetical protein